MKLLANYLRTGLLMAVLAALFMGIGYLIGGRSLAVVALVIAGLMNFFAYWYSDVIVLKAHGARVVGPDEAPRLYGLVQELASRAELPMPKVAIVPDEAPNAFATGRSPRHAVVAATEGILHLMNDRELRGVLAHELAHIKNRDMLIQTFTATVAGAVSMLANILSFSLWFGGDDEDSPGGLIGTLLVIILAPILAAMVQMAVSRSREYEADRVGALVAGDPEGLASALERLAAYHERIPSQVPSPAMQHLYIAQPLSGDSLASLFSTHPPIQERVRRLRAMARGV